MKKRVSIAAVLLTIVASITLVAQPSPSSGPSLTRAVTSPSVPSPQDTTPSHREQGSGELSATAKLDEILVALRVISDKIQPVKAESLFTKLKDDYLSNLVWEFLGYHRGKGGYIPFVVSLIAFVTALLKLLLTFASKRKDRPVYKTFDATVSIAFFGIAVAALWLVFGGPVIAPVAPVDLSPLQEQVVRLQASADRLAASHVTLDPMQFSKLLTDATAACSDLRKSNRLAFASTNAQIAQISASVPGYGCLSLIFAATAIGAAAAVWLLGLKQRWW